MFVYLIVSGWSRHKWRDTLFILTVIISCLLCRFPSFWLGGTQKKAAVEELNRVIINWSQDEAKSQGLYLLSHCFLLFYRFWCFSPSSVNFKLLLDISISAFIRSIYLFTFLFQFSISFFILIFRSCSEGQWLVRGTAVAYDAPERRLFWVWQRRDRTRLHLHDFYEGPFGWNL